MTFILIVLFLFCLFPLGYLYLLLLASVRRLPDLSRRSDLRFAVAIPAHNEEAVIEGTLRAIRSADYPSELVDIYLVADHCSDHTAEIASKLGARVYEHNIGERGGKGPALGYLFNHIFEDRTKYDAVVIFDADTRVSPSFFRIMSSRIDSGAQIIQGNHVIRNHSAGCFPALTWAMFLIDNRYQNLGRANLGLSAKNMGDSICFRIDISKRLGWGEGLTEDYQFRQKLLLHGIRIEYEPRAIGMGDAAANFSEARKQRERWLRGTYQASRSAAFSMLKEGIKSKNFALIDGALQAVFPSYSTLTLIIVLFTLFSWVVSPWIWNWLLWSWCFMLLAAFIFPLLALKFEHAPLKAYLVILTGPIYILWRTAIGIHSRFIKKNVEWVRTPRH